MQLSYHHHDRHHLHLAFKALEEVSSSRVTRVVVRACHSPSTPVPSRDVQRCVPVKRGLIHTIYARHHFHIFRFLSCRPDADVAVTVLVRFKTRVMLNDWRRVRR